MLFDPKWTTTTAAPASERLPTFKPRWWHRRDRLDARPVMWSLYNRPGDWEWAHENYTIRHKPSEHVFWIANGWGCYSLRSADCSCTSQSDRGKFQIFQQFPFGLAFKAWRSTVRPSVDNEQFAAHFIR